MRIKAAVARRTGARLDIASLDLDEPRDDEILVRLIACGVARVDRDAVAGATAMPLPFVPGSEGAGIVERVGKDVSSPAPGDAVLLAYAACGACDACRGGDPRRCTSCDALNRSGTRSDGSSPFTEDGTAVNGFFLGQSAFATHLVCRARDAIVLDDDVPLELFAGLGGEFLTGAAPVFHHGPTAAAAAIVITGAGTVGLAACLVAKAQGFTDIFVAEPDEKRRALALDAGAAIVVPSDEGLAAVVRSSATTTVRLAIETSGTRAGRDACLASVPDGGLCVFSDAFPSPEELGRRPHAVRMEAADTGVVAADIVPKLARLYARGDLPIETIVNFFPFDQVNDAIDAAAANKVVKAVLRFPLGGFDDLDRALVEGAAIDEPSGEPQSDDEDARQTAGAPATA